MSITQDDSKNEFSLNLEEWAYLNQQRYEESENDHRVIGFEYQGFFITNPFLSVNASDEVDPLSYYGKAYTRWLDKYNAAALNHARSNDSNS